MKILVCLCLLAIPLVNCEFFANIKILNFYKNNFLFFWNQTYQNKHLSNCCDLDIFPHISGGINYSISK